ncbi:hypothetical protein HK101_002026 [Irineochytrium annulatum]|nr:hypothetical protein HK101_002026 [Irineochytrium annulatum]
MIPLPEPEHFESHLAADRSMDHIAADVPKKSFHIFISYRVKTDADLAEKLCDKLQALSVLNEQRDIRIKCFLDKQNLTHGENYKAEFLRGLAGSCLFLPIVSEGVLKGMMDLQEGSIDNVLLEWAHAVDMRDQGYITIIPILVGSNSTGGNGTFYKRFDAFWLASKVPDVHVYDSPQRLNSREVVEEIFKLQGIFLNPLDVADKLKLIAERFSTDVWVRFRSVWEDQSSLGVEPVATCVQCNKDFKNSDNGDGACRFHIQPQPESTYRDCVYTCCNMGADDTGCQRNRHRAKHHNDYRYGNFYIWYRGIVNYTDSSEELAKISCYDYADENPRETVTVSAGRVLSKVITDKDKLYVSVVSSVRTLFLVFSEQEVASADPGRPLFKAHYPSGEWAEVSWLTNGNDICGVKMSCRTDSSPPTSCALWFAWPEPRDEDGPRATLVEYDECPAFGELPLKPGSDYELSTSVFYEGKQLLAPMGRKRDEKLPAWSSPGSALRAKVTSTQVEHIARNNFSSDIFTAELMVMNPSREDRAVVGCASFARLRVDPDDKDFVDEGAVEGTDSVPPRLSGKEWVAATSAEATGLPPPQAPPPVMQVQAPTRLPNGRMVFAPPPIYRAPERVEPAKLPVNIPAGGAVSIVVTTRISTFGYGGTKVSKGRLNYSFIAFMTKSPVVLDIELEDMNGEKFGALVEYPLPNIPFKQPDAEALMWMYIDSTIYHERNIIQCKLNERPDPTRTNGSDFSKAGEGDLISVNDSNRGRTLPVSFFRSVITKVETEGGDETFVDISEAIFGHTKEDTTTGIKRRCFALIDRRRRIVYALRLELEGPESRAVGFLRMPEYGDATVSDPEEHGVEAVDCGMSFKPDGMIPLPPHDGQLTSRPQGTPPVPLRMTFEPASGTAGGAAGAGGAGAVVDVKALAEALRPVIRAEVDEALRVAMEGLADRIGASMRGTANAVADPDAASSEPKREEGGEVAMLAELVGKMRDVVRAETDAQSVRIEKALTATAAAATAVQIRSQAASVNSPSSAASSKKSF